MTRTKPNESAIERETFKKLRSLGWIDDIYNPRQNIWTQQPATEDQRKRMNGKRADIILYKSGNNGTDLGKPLIIIECKRPGENIADALNQGIEYAKCIDAPIVIATTGEFIKCYNVKSQQILTINGEDVKDLFSEEYALKFIENPHLITKESKVILSRQELIKVFEEVNELLWKIGLQKGDERFSEFANILFLKIIGEIEETKKSKHDKNNRYFWNSFCNKKGVDLKNAIDVALKHFQEKYNEEDLFSSSKIESEKVLERIVGKLNPLSLIDTKTDIKGEAFEYFLQKYNSGSKDLGEYFTPRHIIKSLISILQPRFKEKVYDPFCGTGGILTECFKYVSTFIKDNEENREELKKCFFGNEISRTARIAKMNMILFGDGHNSIVKRNTLGNPVENEYDLVVTNIPFGQNDGENEYGYLYQINCKYGDCLAIQHCLKACKDNGRVALIMPEGFFTERRKKSYRETKKWILDNFSIQAIISLPQGTFLPYTGAKSSIVIIEKKKREREYFYYYQVKNDGFSLNNRRDKLEGINDLDILVSSWKKIVLEEKEENSSFKKIYYKDVEEDNFNLIKQKYENSIRKSSGIDYLSLKEVADIIRGPFGSDLKKSDYVRNGFIKVYHQENAIKDDFGRGDRYITGEKYEKLKKYELVLGDIIMSSTGTIGKVSVFPSNARRGIISTALTIVRIKDEWKDRIITDYLVAILRTSQTEEIMQRESTGTGVKHIQKKDIEELVVPFCLIEDQKRVVCELNDIKKSTEDYEKSIELLKEKKKKYLSSLW